MSDEMKLLYALCEALGFSVERTVEVIEATQYSDPRRIRHYKVIPFIKPQDGSK